MVGLGILSDANAALIYVGYGQLRLSHRVALWMLALISHLNQSVTRAAPLLITDKTKIRS